MIRLQKETYELIVQTLILRKFWLTSKDHIFTSKDNIFTSKDHIFTSKDYIFTSKK